MRNLDIRIACHLNRIPSASFGIGITLIDKFVVFTLPHRLCYFSDQHEFNGLPINYSANQHRAKWQGATCRNSGSDSRHTSTALLQRGEKLQPFGKS